jgi:ceramide kinase
MRVDMATGAHRYAVCVASYGYMGDLMATSERLRCLGPARYGIAGMRHTWSYPKMLCVLHL